VNDVAQINIDAKLIRSQSAAGITRGSGQEDPSVRSTSDLADTLELSNGCACCSIQDELFDSFRQMLTLSDRRGKPFDAIVLENSGVAEPRNIRDLFQDARQSPDAARRAVAGRVALANLVTVVDGSTFAKDFASRLPLATRPDLGDGGGLRPVVDLLVEQVECADVVVVNKADLLPEGKAASLGQVVASLNPLARVVLAKWGAVDVPTVLGTREQSLMARLTIEGTHRGALEAAMHHSIGALPGSSSGRGDQPQPCTRDHAHGPDCQAQRSRQDTTASSKYGITTFVYCRRRPFHPQRLRATVLKWIPAAASTSASSEIPRGAPSGTDTPLRKVIRSKGFVWMSSSHRLAYYWSHAGQHFEVREEGDWWSEVPADEWPKGHGDREAILRDFDAGDSRVGDRRQEVIFIGQGMDEAAIVAALDEALLTDEEMGQYWERWGRGDGRE